MIDGTYVGIGFGAADGTDVGFGVGAYMKYGVFASTTTAAAVRRTADFIVMLAFGASCMVLLAPWISVHFLGSSLAFMMVYVWGRRNEGVRMSFLGLFPFTAPYLAWVLLAFSMVMGNPPTTDVVGICVGHSYYWLEYVYPKLAEIRGFRWKRPLAVPSVFTRPWFRRRVAVPENLPELHAHQD